MRARVAEQGLAGLIQVDSAGTQGFHGGEPPDRRSQHCAAQHGVDLSGLKARKLRDSDYAEFDIIAAMDHGHLAHMQRHCPAHLADRLHLFMSFAPDWDGPQDVPDPYYGEFGFEEVFQMVEAGVAGLIAKIKADQAA